MRFKIELDDGETLDSVSEYLHAIYDCLDVIRPFVVEMAEPIDEDGERVCACEHEGNIGDSYLPLYPEAEFVFERLQRQNMEEHGRKPTIKSAYFGVSEATHILATLGHYVFELTGRNTLSRKIEAELEGSESIDLPEKIEQPVDTPEKIEERKRFVAELLSYKQRVLQ